MSPHAQHPARIEPGPGQESVWDYPRPPRLELSEKLVVVRAGDREVGRTQRAYRVLETSHPPTWYLPPEDLDRRILVPGSGTSVCEWKGPAAYWNVLSDNGIVLESVGWSYPRPTPSFRSIAGYVSFYPGHLECEIDGERVRPQEGGFYGGWVTDDIVGPFKGGPGSWGW